jgi:hypothetical protein
MRQNWVKPYGIQVDPEWESKGTVWGRCDLVLQTPKTSQPVITNSYLLFTFCRQYYQQRKKYKNIYKICYTLL